MDAAAVAWLESGEGRAATAEAARLLAEPGATELSVSRRLRRTLDAGRVRDVLALIEGRRAAAPKFRDAGALFLDRTAAEQASPEAVARYTASRLVRTLPPGPSIVADLGCGAGGDALALAELLPEGTSTLAVDRDEARLAMLAANTRARGLEGRVRTCRADIEAWTAPPAVAAAWLDPSRRNGRGRVLDPEGWSPPLPVAIEAARRFPAAGIKLAPGIDAALLPAEGELEFISLGGRLVEAVLWLGRAAEARSRATVLPAGASLARQAAEAEPAARVSAPGAYLFDPDPAVGRAGLVRELAAHLEAWQIDGAVAYLCTDEPRGTPFARRFRVLDVRPFSERAVMRALHEASTGRVEVTRRGAPVDTNALERRLNARLPGGEPVHTLALTRIEGRITALLCVRERDGG